MTTIFSSGNEILANLNRKLAATPGCEYLVGKVQINRMLSVGNGPNWEAGVPLTVQASSRCRLQVTRIACQLQEKYRLK